MTLKKVSALLAVVPLVLVAACGSSSKSSSSSTGGGAPAASSSTAAAAVSPVTLSTKKHGKLGTILAAGSKDLTVYLFEADRGARSACSGPCAKFWPPVIGTAKASGQAMSADLGTIKRADGQLQVTYKGHPLYYFVKDKDGGDAYGQGIKAFGASWYVLKPSGQKVDQS